jgi:hypothetical protein
MMDAFEALLQDAPATPAKSAPAADPFAALLAQPAGPPRAKPKPAREPAGAARMAVAGGAELVDMLLTGAFGMPLAATREGLTRVQRTVENQLGFGKGAKMTREEIGQEASADATRILDQYGSPALSLLRRWGFIDQEDRTAVEQGFAKIMEKVEETGAAVEERTGGKVLKEDVTQAVNLAFGALGVKGTQIIGKGTLSRMKAKAAAKALDDLKGERAAENLAESAAVETGPRQPPALADYKAYQKATPEERAAYTPEQREAMVEFAQARREAKAKARAAFAGDPFVAGRTPRTRPGEKTAVDEAPRDLEISREVPGQDLPAYLQRPSGVYVPAETTPQMRVAAPDALTSGTAKVARGRPFDLTAEERIAIRGSKQIVDPKIATAAIVGATGLGLALALEPNAEEAALAIGAGALIAGRGRGLTLEALRTMPPATPLGRILDQSAYTLSTLEMLPKNRFEFGKPSIAQLLKRDSVTKAERAILQDVLDSVPGETITAKQLMEGVKARTGDFELKRAESNSFADYGLDRIDRETDLSQQIDAEPWIPEGTAPDVEAQMRATHAAARADAARRTAEPTTTIYQSPVELGTANHFGDPNYFAHTRSFVEGGVKHVVELQSDVAQKAGKVLTPENKAQFEAEASAIEADLTQLKAILRDEAALSMKDFRWRLQQLPEYLQTRIGDAINQATGVRRANALEADGVWIKRGLKNVADDLAVRHAEISAKLAENSPLATVSPMLKDWHKRLVREELASSAAKGEPAVRFADADTVAKVEGWARARPREVDQKVVDLRDELARVKELGYTAGEGWFDQVQSALTKAEEAQAKAPPAPRFSPEHQGIYDRYARDVTKFLKSLGGKHVVDASGHGWWEVPVEGSKATPAGRRVQQFGGLDADLAKAVAVIGGGAWLASVLSNPENRTKNAVWAAAVLSLGMFAKSRISGLEDMAESAGRRLENAGGKISLELRNISQPLGRRLFEFDMDEMVETAKRIKTIAPFIKSLHKAGAAARGPLNDAILTGKPGPVLAALGKLGKPEVIQQWKTARALLEDLGKGLIDAGRLKQLLPDYFPRMVVDYPGLLKALGLEARTYLETMMEKENLKSLREKGVELSPLDQSLVVNKYLERAVNGQGKPGFLKKRSIEEITAELSPFYAPAMESLPLYIRAVVKEIERAKFFGKDLVRLPESGAINLDTSIGNLVNRELAAGRVKPEQVDRVKDLLRSRFGPGEQGSSRGIQAFRNVTNAMLLGDVFSALRNLGDIGPIYAMYNGLSLAKSAAALITRDSQRITAVDMGMAKHLAEEFVHGTRRPVLFKLPLTDKQIQLSTARFADLSFKLGGFRFVDVGMKELAANTALSYYQAAVKKPRTLAEFRARYGEFFGKDFDALVADLQAKRTTRLTRMLATRELADLQPLFKSEMSKFYNDHPDGRVLYMLKSFTLSQINLVRDRGFAEMKRGNVRRGTEFLLRYTLLAGFMGMTTDNLIRSLQERDTSWNLLDLPAHALKNFGWSQYALDKLRSGKPEEAALAIAAPPVKPIYDVLTGKPEAVRYVPVVGEAAYYHGMGGADKANYLERQRKKREARDAASPEAAARRRKKAKEAFEKRVRESAAAQRP